jgi:hypothetical protein
MDRTYTTFEAGERRYPALPVRLKTQLDRIVPSICGALRYFPCCIRTKEGQTIDRVYVVDAQQYIDVWGVWPDQDSRKAEVRIQDVDEIFESPTRLPPRIANELYRAGESGMGYIAFSVTFKDGARTVYVCGGALDFVSLPPSRSVEDIAEVVPHVGRDRAVSENLPYYWCIHGYGKQNGP